MEKISARFVDQIVKVNYWQFIITSVHIAHQTVNFVNQDNFQMFTLLIVYLIQMIPKNTIILIFA